MNKPRLTVQATIVIFMLVTVVHVTMYSASFEPVWWLKWLGAMYAIAVELSIVVCAYFTRWQSAKRWAWTGFFLFTVASGIMNWGWIGPETFPAWIYTLFPTGAIALLGFLYRQVDINRIGVKTAHSTSEPIVRTQSEPVKTLEPELSDRQKQIAELVNTGVDNKSEIARQLSISRQTLYNELSTLEALGVVNNDNGTGYTSTPKVEGGEVKSRRDL